MTDNQRTIAGRYQVKDLIGRGGMADVFEGVDSRLGRVVAIKILKADLAADSTFESRFRQEAQASARMAHPNIVRIYDAGEEQITDANGNLLRRPYIVMEFVRGDVLRDVINNRQLEVRDAVSFAEGVLTALEVSHRAGVIHRDIKSANIMITEQGKIKVMDFGIARAITDSSATQAHTSGIVGTAQYFSPEQAKGETVDSRTDLYSTGVLLYEMLTGRAPFRGETAVSVAYQHVSEAVIPPSQINPNLSPELDAVVLRALAKDRNDRFQSAEQFREHLLAAFAVSRNFVSPNNNQASEPVGQLEDFFVEEPAPAQVQPELQLELQEDIPLVEETPVASEANTTASTPTTAATEVFGFEDLLDAAVAESNSSSPGAGAADAQSPFSEANQSPRDAQGFTIAKKASSIDAYVSEHTNPFSAIGVEFEAEVETDSRASRSEKKKFARASRLDADGYGARSSEKTKAKSAIWFGASALVVILLGLGIWSIATLGNYKVNVPTTNLSVTVPDVTGKTYDEANSALSGANLLVTRTYQADDAVALDTVISTDPPAGAEVSPHTTITVYVSGGKAQVKVPYLIGKKEADANADLTAVGLALGKITQQNSVDQPKGTILSTNPEQYLLLAKGTSVDVVVSTGKVTVPSVLQQSVTAAKAVLTGPDVAYTVTVESSTPGCTGTLGQIVTAQSIAAGDAGQHKKIVIYVDCIGGSTTGPTPSVTPAPTSTP